MKIYGDNGIKITLPSGGGIEDVTVGGVSVVDDNVAVIPEIPTKTSDLTNDMGFITSSSLPTKVSDLTNDLGFITQTALANYVENTDFATTDVGGVVKASDTTKFYVNVLGTPMADVIQYQNWASTSEYAFVGKGTLNNVLTAKAYITENDIPSNISYFTNDAGYITASDIPDPSVGDVLINGTSIVDSDGDADIPVADGNGYGVIKGLSGAGYVADNGELYASTLTAANYGTAQNYLFISKGTLENVLANKGYALSSDIPTKVSDLTNDSGFVTSSSLPTKVSDLTNDLGFVTASTVPVRDVTIGPNSIVWSDHVAVLPTVAAEYFFEERLSGYLLQPKDIDSAVKAALCDGNGPAYTSTEQAAAQQRLGISSGNSDPTVYLPSGSANDAANIQTILDTYKSCRLAPGTYLLESEITMYDDYCLMGSGPSTILTFSASPGSGERALLKFCYAPSGSVADDRGGITVKDLTLRGAETISDSYITTNSSVGNDHGIRTVSDDTSIGVYKSPNKVQNVIFEKFTGYCFKQGASAYTNVDYTFGTTGRYTTNRVDFNGCTFRSSHGGYYDSGHNYTSGIAFVDCLFNFLFLGIRIGGMGVDGVNTKFTEIYGQILMCQTTEYYLYLENSFTGCYFDGTHCSESADIRVNPYGDPNIRTIFTSCIFIANKGYIYNGTVSCCNCRFVNSKQTYSGYIEMELEGLDAITSFICCSSDAIFDAWGQAYSNGKCKFVGCYKDDGTEIK